MTLPPLGPMLDALESLVVRESPSRDKAALDVLSSFIAGRFESPGVRVDRVPNPNGGDHLRVARHDGVANSGQEVGDRISH